MACLGLSWGVFVEALQAHKSLARVRLEQHGLIGSVLGGLRGSSAVAFEEHDRFAGILGGLR